MNCPHCAATSPRERAKKTKLGYAIFFCPHCRHIFNERTGTPFTYLEFPTDIVLLAVLWRLRSKLSLRDVAEMVLERGFMSFWALSSDTTDTTMYPMVTKIGTVSVVAH
jgi:putative transposase